jgi:hypothetical protein
VCTGKFKKYSNWVNSREELDHVPLFSCEHIDHYFLHIASRAYRAGQPENVRKLVNVLQWYCRFWYNHIPFVVESIDVLSALWLPKVHGGESTGNPGGDSLRRLKDAVPERDHILIMNCIYRNRKDWDTASVNYLRGCQGAIYGTSNRALVLSDLDLWLWC